MGTSPVDVKLKGGRTYEIRLEKQGYRITIRRVSIPAVGKKPTRLSTDLEKLKWYMPQ